jgi:hypothetical protein
MKTVTKPASRQSPEDDQPEEDVVEALAGALKPIVGALQDRLVGVGEWIEAIKIAACRAAHESTNAERGQAVVSRLSIRTGMSRAEQINRRRRMVLGSTGRRSVGSHRLIRVIDGWFDHPDFHGGKGRRRPLGTGGTEPHFRTLSRPYAGDVHPLSVVADIQHYGLIRERGTGLYSPISSDRDSGLKGARQFERHMYRHWPALIEARRESAPKQ